MYADPPHTEPPTSSSTSTTTSTPMCYTSHTAAEPPTTTNSNHKNRSTTLEIPQPRKGLIHWNLLHIIRLCKGLLMSGGNQDNGEDPYERSIEIIDLSTGKGCRLPDLPTNRRAHTQVNIIVCL